MAESVSRSLPILGSVMEIRLEGDNSAALEAAAGEALKEARRLDSMLSNRNPNSEVSRINRAAGRGPVQVTDEMIKFILLSNRMSYLCDGFFDITVEPLSRLWALRERTLGVLPTDQEVAEAAAKVDSNDIDISFRNNTIRFAQEGMGIDSDVIGRGYILDRCLKRIQAVSQVQTASLVFNRECLFWSRDPAHHFFSVKHPLSPESAWDSFAVSTFSAVSAISTNGIYDDYVSVSTGAPRELYARFPDGRVGHVLNPKTGVPVRNEIRSVSVIATSGAEADALSSAIFSMGLEEGAKFADSLAESAVLILYEQSGKLQSFKSENWARIVNPQI